LGEGSGIGRPLVSVVIPVFDAAGPLADCLRALALQTLERARFEVIVIDNGSSDRSRQAAAEAGAIVVGESRPGSYAARNRGLSLTRADVVAFTDADCEPDPRWLERGLGHVQREPDTVVAGRIAFRPSDRTRPTAVERYEQFTALQQRRFVEQGGFGATANLFVPRRVFDRVGLFDATLKSGGDVEWCQRATAAGYRLRYADEVTVSHPPRRTWRDLYRKVRRTIGGAHDLRGRARLLGIDRPLMADWVPPVRYALEAWRSPEIRGVGPKLQVIGVMCLVRYAEALERLRLRIGGTSRR
jgi:glycosyltransferase involved in cell wall biosynthesis